MRRMRTAGLVVACIAPAGAALAMAPAPGTGANTAVLSPAPEGAVQREATGESSAMVEQINAARAEHGLRPLGTAPVLERSALAYAHRLIETDIFAHARRIGPHRRFRTTGEMLALHSGRRPRYAATVRSWLASPSHRALMLSRRFRRVGAGRESGRFGRRPTTIWVIQLGGPG